MGMSARLPGNNQCWGLAVRHHWRKISSSRTESMTYRSFRPLPCSIRMTMRWLSISTGFKWTVDRFRYPRPCRVADRQNGAVLDVLHALQKLENFLGTENDR